MNQFINIIRRLCGLKTTKSPVLSCIFQELSNGNESGFKLVSQSNTGGEWIPRVHINLRYCFYPNKDGVFRVKVDTNEFNSNETSLGASTS